MIFLIIIFYVFTRLFYLCSRIISSLNNAPRANVSSNFTSLAGEEFSSNKISMLHAGGLDVNLNDVFYGLCINFPHSWLLCATINVNTFRGTQSDERWESIAYVEFAMKPAMFLYANSSRFFYFLLSAKNKNRFLMFHSENEANRWREKHTTPTLIVCLAFLHNTLLPFFFCFEG